MTKAMRSRIPRICIIGIGNEFRNDDGVGLLVARNLSTRQIPGVSVRECSGVGSGIMDAWDGADIVFLVDAVCSGAPAGTTSFFDGRRQKIPSRFFNYSTHAFSLAESVELAKKLGRLPKRCLIYGVEGKDFTEGTNITPTVAAAADEVVAAILKKIRSVSTMAVREQEDTRDELGEPSPSALPNTVRSSVRALSDN